MPVYIFQQDDHEGSLTFLNSDHEPFDEVEALFVAYGMGKLVGEAPWIDWEAEDEEGLEERLSVRVVPQRFFVAGPKDPVFVRFTHPEEVLASKAIQYMRQRPKEYPTVPAAIVVPAKPDTFLYLNRKLFDACAKGLLTDLIWSWKEHLEEKSEDDAVKTMRYVEVLETANEDRP